MALAYKGTFLLLFCCSVFAASNSFKAVKASTTTKCENFQLVETMPLNMDYGANSSEPHFTQTIDALLDIVNKTEKHLQIASFYWILTANAEHANHSSAKPGKDLMNAIEEAATKRGVKVEIVIDGRNSNMNQKSDIQRLEKFASLKALNVSALFDGQGVMHSKFMIGDSKRAYLGSSNFDWRSYTHVKEVGIKFDDCQELAEDLGKIFKMYQLVADTKTLPTNFSNDLKTKYNLDLPLTVDNLIGSRATVAFAAAPMLFNKNYETGSTTNRSDDIEAIVRTIDAAKEFVYISVLNYSPETQFMRPREYLPWIDIALRAVVSERHVQVKLLFSDWSNADEISWYKSLDALKFKKRRSGISVKRFVVPKTTDFEKNLPFARVKHDKYLVTEKSVYIGTSNWTPDYFIDTCGVGFTANFGSNSSLIHQVKELFLRDFNSKFASQFA